MPKSKVRVAVLDTETTGLPRGDDLNNHRIIEIAVSMYSTTDNGETHRKIGDTWVKRCNPLRSIDKGAEQVHGISLMSLKSEPEFVDIAPKLKQILDFCDIIVAHNLEFDMPFIMDELSRSGQDILFLGDKEAFCTMKDGRAATAMGKLPSLKEICFATGVEYDDTEAHAADYDTEVLAAAFWNGVKSGLFKPQRLREVEND